MGVIEREREREKERERERERESARAERFGRGFVNLGPGGSGEA